MRRALGLLLGDWPLKLGAVGLATVLYGGIVLTEAPRDWLGRVPITAIGLPDDATLLGVLPDVTSIEYRAPLEVASRLSTGSFVATVDVSNITPVEGGEPVEVDVSLRAVDRRVEIIDFSPPTVQVALDPVTRETMPVRVIIPSAPPGLEVGPPQADPDTVTVEGASSRVDSVRTVQARVTIDDSAVNVDEQAELVPVDLQGNEVVGLELTPERVRVRIAVARILTTRTVPVRIRTAGQPAAGLRVASVTSEPVLVTVNGSQPAVEQLQAVETEPLDLSGRDESFEAEVGLALPPEVTALVSSTVTVTVTLEPERGSRTYEVGVLARGARPELTYTLAAPTVLVELAGTLADLDALDPGALRATVDVEGLGVGSHSLPVEVDEPSGLVLVGTAPEEVTVAIGQTPMPASPAPPASSAPASPPGSP